MTIQEHIESLIFMLIIKLRQQTLILEKSWMRKHKVSYHEKTNIIEFVSEFCIHSKRIKTKTTSSSNKKKNFFFEKKSFLNQSNHSKFDDSIKNSRKFLTIVIKVLFRKELNSDQSSINLFRKNKNSSKSINKIEDQETIKISNSILMSSQSLIRKKRNSCLRWTLRWLKHSSSTWWINVKTWICFSSLWKT
jgi:hypothetical protein